MKIRGMKKMKKNIVPDKLIPVSSFSFAKEKNGALVRYFGIPVIVDNQKTNFTTIGGINTKKMVSILWLNAPNKVSEETREWMKIVLKINESEYDMDHPIILVDNRLFKFHIFGLSKRQLRAVIAFYSAKAMMQMADGPERLLSYLESVSDENAAKVMFKRIYDASDEALEYVSDVDTMTLQLLLAASEIDTLPKKILSSVGKNEKKIGVFATRQFKISKKEMKKVAKAEKKAASEIDKMRQMKTSDDNEPSDVDLMDDSIIADGVPVDTDVVDTENT